MAIPAMWCNVSPKRFRRDGPDFLRHGRFNDRSISALWWKSGRATINTRTVECRDPAPLLKGDHVGAAQRRGLWLQRHVRQVAIALIQYLIEADGLLVVGCGRGRVHRNHDGVIAQRR